MTNFRPGVVIPLGAGRQENLMLVLRALHEQTRKPEAIVIVADGPDAGVKIEGTSIPMIQVFQPKHEPGAEQPRNVGVRLLTQTWPDCNAAWFLDTDVIVGPDVLQQLARSWESTEHERVIMAPYDWLPPGQRQIDPSVRNDPRWPMFDEWAERGLDAQSIGELNVGLGCFSGNLVWSIAEFTRIGGFWNEIHHGRCEDGELGLRAVALEVPISLCAGARGYHLWHPIDVDRTMKCNARDVPMLNARHPWVEGEGVLVVERDGRRFDQRCGRCGELVNTIDWWEHRSVCEGSTGV
jgi:GT2 family glycosyltransferase